MAHQVIMPKQGLQMTEGYITAWRKKEGDRVSIGEPLFEMETDKLHIVIDSAVEGTLLKIVRPEGETVPITQVIAYIGEPGESVNENEAESAGESILESATGSLSSDKSEEKSVPVTPDQRLFITPRARMRAEEKGLSLSEVSGSGPDGLVIERDVLGHTPVRQAKASPLAKKIAGLAGVTTAKVQGTGDRGKVMADDVRGYLKTADTTPEGQDGADTLVPMNGMRRGIATQMKASLDSQAQASHRMSVDMSECVRLREKHKALGKEVSYNDIIVLAAARALRENPGINVSREGDGVLWKSSINIGLAVSTDQGLLVPVITKADQRSLSDISSATSDLAQRARSGRLTLDELTGGTFTVTNLGMYGIDSFIAICNAPESAILAVGAIKKQPVVMPDGGIMAREMMWLSLTYDHCVIDGAPAARFLQRIGQFLENPTLML